LDDVQLDTKAHRVTNGQEEVTLTHREYDLLQFFLAHPDEVFTRDDLLDQVWGADFLGQQNVVDVYVGYLRNKITTTGASPLIQTVRGVGYKLREPMSDAQK
ncbi:DNA-binding response regulator, partial [Streptococcus thermophilus]|nr:DNA-binding response regulator [Streptococcus thermophilus]